MPRKARSATETSTPQEGSPRGKGRKNSASRATQALASPPGPGVDPIFGFPITFEPGTTFELPLWSKWPQAVLKQEYKKGAWTFDLGFRQRARREESRLFDIGLICKSGVLVKDLLPAGAIMFGGFDPAGEKRIGNALVTVGVTAQNSMRVIKEIRMWKGLFSETAQEIAIADLRHRFGLLVVENVSLQGAIIELIHYKAPQIPIVGYASGQSKSHPELGLPGLAEEVKAGLWALCIDDPYDTGTPLAQHEPSCECAYHTFLGDLNGYPSESRTYDPLMAWWFARQGIRGDYAGSTIPYGAEIFDPAELDGEIPDDELGGNIFGRSFLG